MTGVAAVPEVSRYLYFTSIMLLLNVPVLEGLILHGALAVAGVVMVTCPPGTCVPWALQPMWQVREYREVQAHPGFTLAGVWTSYSPHTPLHGTASLLIGRSLHQPSTSILV